MRLRSQHRLGSLALLAGAVALLAVRPQVPAGDNPTAAGGEFVLQGYTEKIPESAVRFEMVAIPGGTFTMGSPAGEKRRADDEGPQHVVKLRPFWMGRFEVTWDEFDLYRRRDAQAEARARADPNGADAVSRPSEAYIDEKFGFGDTGYPVVGITHHAAMEYCHWLSLKTGKVYRLPTEAEWEYACRAGSRSAYFFGDDPKGLGDYAWYGDNGGEVTHPVGQKKPNPWGLYDVLGNVAEWCLDRYDRRAYARDPADRVALAPLLPPTADRFPDVVRGGSWADGAPALRSAARRASDKSWQRIDPATRKSIWWLPNADFVGFRVVRAADGQDGWKHLRSQVTKESK
jgi:formylglycine-generating enzyme required for sulfatase activity